MMNSHQRFLETMNYGSPDHAPLFEEGLRKDVIRSWKKQGLRSEKELSHTFIYDQVEEIDPDLYPTRAFPFKSGSTSDREALRKDLNPEDKSRFPRGWKAKAHRCREAGDILMLRVHVGFFLTMGVDGWNSFSNVIPFLVDDPRLIMDIMDIQAEFCARIAERVLNEVDFDAVIFSEPISSTHGPLISPKMYEEFVLRSYNPVFDVIQKFNIQTVIIRTYANSKALLPVILKTPINCLWASESNMEFMDYRLIRKEFGRDLRLIGGIDTDVLLKGKDAIQHEIESKVVPLLEQGGYIPLADARIREYVPFENYVHYRQTLEKMVLGG